MISRLCIILTLLTLSITPFTSAVSNPFQRLTTNLQLQSSTTFTCTNVIYDCSSHGYCNDNKDSCICDKGYTTYNCNSTSQCCYEEENRTKMFIIAFFTSWLGVSYFMVGAVVMGVLILSLCLCGCVFAAVGWVTKDSACGVVMLLVGILLMIAVFVWHIELWSRLAAGTETYGDKNGIPIAPWR